MFNYKYKTKKAKGFIGSIGDDLPSLIPLFFALMLFFGALAFAFTTINERNSLINTYIDSLTIAKNALSDGSFADLNEFKATQNNIVTMSNYIFGLIYLPSNKSDQEGFDFESMLAQDFHQSFVGDCSNGDIALNFNVAITNNNSDNCSVNDYFYVSSSSVQEKINNNENLLQNIKSHKYFYYLYPVTLLTHNGYQIVYLLVIVW
jgi:hypothetical protein